VETPSTEHDEVPGVGVGVGTAEEDELTTGVGEAGGVLELAAAAELEADWALDAAGDEVAGATELARGVLETAAGVELETNTLLGPTSKELAWTEGLGEIAPTSQSRREKNNPPPGFLRMTSSGNSSSGKQYVCSATRSTIVPTHAGNARQDA
jgi:hypothetical protein